MGKHKKGHRTYPDSGKKHEKNRPQTTPRRAIRTNQPDGMNQPNRMSADMLSQMTALPSQMIAEQVNTKRLVTAESVRAGHPDKLCDQIADAILDAYLQEDENARVAVEVMATQGRIIVAGEITSTAQVNIRRLVCNQIAAIGCGYENLTGSLDAPLEIDIRIHEQSPDIGNAVSRNPVYNVGGEISLADTLGAGDQGVMVGYATNETDEMMPLPCVLAHRICRLLDEAMEQEPWLCSDGKAQVTVLYHGDVPVAVTDVVVSVQHLPGKDGWQKETHMTIDLKTLKAMSDGAMIMATQAEQMAIFAAGMVEGTKQMAESLQSIVNDCARQLAERRAAENGGVNSAENNAAVAATQTACDRADPGYTANVSSPNSPSLPQNAASGAFQPEHGQWVGLMPEAVPRPLRGL